jgi:uncharacterized Tic20 family protein/DNA-directed RNA polymerase subunit RPC12/RpoP
MPITIVCPGCKAKLKAPDNLIGKAVKCPNCSKAVLVKAPAAPAPAPAPTPAPVVKKPARPAPAEVEEVIEDIDEIEDEEIEERPKKRKGGNRSGSTEAERSSASLIHYSTLLNLIVSPVGFIVPLVVWMSKRKDSPFVDHHGKTWLNFHVSMLVLNLGLMFGFGLLATVGYFIAWWLMLIFIVIWVIAILGLSIYVLIMYIVAGSKAKSGDWYEYRVLFKVMK